MLKYCLVFVVFISAAASIRSLSHLHEDLQRGFSGRDAQNGVTARLFGSISSITKVDVVTATVTLTVQQPCAQLVNATSACRRKRGVDQRPLILSLDDDDDDNDDILFNPSPVNK